MVWKVEWNLYLYKCLYFRNITLILTKFDHTTKIGGWKTQKLKLYKEVGVMNFWKLSEGKGKGMVWEKVCGGGRGWLDVHTSAGQLNSGRNKGSYVHYWQSGWHLKKLKNIRKDLIFKFLNSQMLCLHYDLQLPYVFNKTNIFFR